VYFDSTDEQKEIIMSINKRLNCGKIEKLDVDDIDQNVIDEVKENSEFSVFAFL
jgi:hypothetical protein